MALALPRAPNPVRRVALAPKGMPAIRPILIKPRDVLLEVPVFYRGGHPEFPDMASVHLRLHEDRLEFSFDADAPFLRIDYLLMVKVMEPRKGGITGRRRRSRRGDV